MFGPIRWLWTKGVLNNFVAGMFVVLPVAITIGLGGWIVGKLEAIVVPTSEFLKESVEEVWVQITGYELDQKALGFVIGWAFVLVLIWGIGLTVKVFARHRVEESFHSVLNRIPLFNTIYKPVAQVVGLLKKDESNDMSGMSVVMCRFGAEGGGRFLALLASKERYKFKSGEFVLIYIPTSPVPMSGGLIFVPAESVEQVEMSVDDLMKVYFSLGVLAPQVVPEKYKVRVSPA